MKISSTQIIGKRKDFYLLIILLLIQLGVTFLYAASIYNLKYSFIGDEYATYNYAKDIATGAAHPYLFSMNGVYGENPVLGSIYQASIMKIVGINIYGWKLSSIIIIFPLGLLMFYLIKKISGIKDAFLALFILDSSFYLYNFFQIGYLNNLSLLFLVAIMYLLIGLEIDSERKNYFQFILLGILTGLSWYFYIGKLFIFIISLYLLIQYKFNKNLYKYYISFIIPALMIIAFGCASFINSDLGLSKTILHREFSGNIQIVKNIVAPLYLEFYTPFATHYLPVRSYVDPITAGLALIGLIIMIISVFYKKLNISPYYHRLLLLFLLLCLVIGLTSPYINPPTTRGIHYVPFYIIFAVCGFSIIQNSFKKYKVVYIVSFPIFLFLIVFLNVKYILKPLPANTTQEIFSYIANSEVDNYIFLDNCNFSFYNIETLTKGYELKKNVSVHASLSNDMCLANEHIFSCAPISCNSEVIKSFNGIHLFKVN